MDKFLNILAIIIRWSALVGLVGLVYYFLPSIITHRKEIGMWLLPPLGLLLVLWAVERV